MNDEKTDELKARTIELENEVKTLKDRVKTLEMCVRGYEDKAANFGHEHRISCLRGWLETLASGQCLDTAKQHAQAALNADYNLSLREFANLPNVGTVTLVKEPFLVIECNGKKSVVKNIEIDNLSGCSIVGKDDLFDLGFTVEDLEKHKTTIRPILVGSALDNKTPTA